MGSNKDEFEGWLSSAGSMDAAVKPEDANKTAVIISSEFKDTKYGRKLLLHLEVNQEKRGLFLGITMAKEFAKNAGTNPDDWVGKKVVLTEITVQLKDGFRKKLFPTLVK